MGVVSRRFVVALPPPPIPRLQLRAWVFCLLHTFRRRVMPFVVRLYLSSSGYALRRQVMPFDFVWFDTKVAADQSPSVRVVGLGVAVIVTWSCHCGGPPIVDTGSYSSSSVRLVLFIVSSIVV